MAQRSAQMPEMDPEDNQFEEDEDWNDTRWANCLQTKNVPSQPPNATYTKDVSSAGLVKPVAISSGGSGPSSKATSNTSGVVSRMQLNDNKAGMTGLDREKINKIIMEASTGSKFYENERKKEEQVQKRIDKQQIKLESITKKQIADATIEADQLLKQLEATRDLSRMVVHIDMDAFYAAVEMRDNPSLKDKPMAVGGNSMLSTSNYVARRYGVRAAMPGFIAKKLCPNLIIVPVNFAKYTQISKQVRSILAEYDPNFCPMSLDEAYFDLTEHLKKRSNFSARQRTFEVDGKWKESDRSSNETVEVKKKNGGMDNLVVSKPENENIIEDLSSDEELDCLIRSIPAEFVGGENPDANNVSGGRENDLVKIGESKSRTFGLTVDEAVQEIRFRIEQMTGLTASAGIAPNMMLAKVCSDKNKPNGQYRIPSTREAVMNFVKELPIRKISGIGKVTEVMLKALDVTMCEHLREKRAILYHLYSSISFNYFMRISLGIGSTKVERDGERKSMSVERTFNEINKPAELYAKCLELSQALAEDLKEESLKGRTVTIKLKTVTFEVKTRTQSLMEYTSDPDVIYATAKEQLRLEILAYQPKPLRLRLLGVRASNFQDADSKKGKQCTLKDMFRQRHEEPTSLSSETVINDCLTETMDGSDQIITSGNIPLPREHGMEKDEFKGRVLNDGGNPSRWDEADVSFAHSIEHSSDRNVEGNSTVKSQDVEGNQLLDLDVRKYLNISGTRDKPSFTGASSSNELPTLKGLASSVAVPTSKVATVLNEVTSLKEVSSSKTLHGSEEVSSSECVRDSEQVFDTEDICDASLDTSIDPVYLQDTDIDSDENNNRTLIDEEASESKLSGKQKGKSGLQNESKKHCQRQLLIHGFKSEVPGTSGMEAGSESRNTSKGPNLQSAFGQSTESSSKIIVKAVDSFVAGVAPREPFFPNSEGADTGGSSACVKLDDLNGPKVSVTEVDFNSGLFETGANSESRTQTEQGGSGSFRCPVCDRTISCRDILEFNAHLDQCLCEDEDSKSESFISKGAVSSVRNRTKSGNSSSQRQTGKKNGAKSTGKKFTQSSHGLMDTFVIKQERSFSSEILEEEDDSFGFLTYEESFAEEITGYSDGSSEEETSCVTVVDLDSQVPGLRCDTQENLTENLSKSLLNAPSLLKPYEGYSDTSSMQSNGDSKELTCQTPVQDYTSKSTSSGSHLATSAPNVSSAKSIKRDGVGEEIQTKQSVVTIDKSGPVVDAKNSKESSDFQTVVSPASDIRDIRTSPVVLKCMSSSLGGKEVAKGDSDSQRSSLQASEQMKVCTSPVVECTSGSHGVEVVTEDKSDSQKSVSSATEFTKVCTPSVVECTASSLGGEKMPKEKLGSQTKQDSLQCPVCLKNLRTKNLDNFNRHVDMCLSGESKRAQKRPKRKASLVPRMPPTSKRFKVDYNFVDSWEQDRPK